MKNISAKKKTLKAFPFNLGPEEAQRRVAPLAAMTCSTYREALLSIASFARPSLNLEWFRPARFSAVYFPAWFVTGEVEASVIYKGDLVRSITIF